MGTRQVFKAATVGTPWVAAIASASQQSSGPLVTCSLCWRQPTIAGFVPVLMTLRPRPPQHTQLTGN